jgi:hypothetical protein
MLLDDYDPQDEPKRSRVAKSKRIGAPRAARTVTPIKKKTTPGFGGAHRRRNKHWSW